MTDGGSGQEAQTGFRARLEIWAAVLLAVTTVATAFSAYESSRWGGEQSTSFTSAGASRTESAKARSDASSLVTIDASLFTEYAAAVSEENELLAEELRNRFFRDEFKPAFEEWIALKPLKNPEAPATPFELDSYQPQRLLDSLELEEEASALFDRGREANQTSDDYTLATIFFAVVLFFAGIATKFRGDRVALGMLVLAQVTFLGGVIRLITLPFL